MAINYRSLVTGSATSTDSADYHKMVTGIASPKTFTPQAPTPPIPPTPEQPKNIFQKTGDIVKDFGVGIAKPFVKSYELLSQAAPVYGAVLKGGAQMLTGNKQGGVNTITEAGKKAEINRANPINFGGQQINRIKTTKDVVGTALEIASYGIGAGEAMAAKNIIKQTLATGLQYGSKQAAISAAKQIVTRLAVGGLGGATYGAGAAMQENKDAKNIAIDAAKNFGIGAAFELGMLGLGAGGAIVARKFDRVLKGLKPLSLEEKNAAIRGEEYLPSKIKIGEPITNAADNKITYQKDLNLGHDASGQPIMSRVEVNPKTGEAKVFVAKQLDKNPGQKALVIENAHDEIVRLKMEGVKSINKTMASKSVEDFGLRIGKTEPEISAILKKELTQYNGDLVAARKEFIVNPVVVKEKAPTVAALLEHQTDPNINIITTSIRDLEEKQTKRIEDDMLKRADAYKAEQAAIKPSSETYTPTAAKKLENSAIENKIIQDPIGIPEVEKVHIKDQIALHAEIENDRALINRILTGAEEAPGKLKAASVWRIEAEKAAKNGDIGMIQELAKSPLARQFSEEGANIAMLRGMNYNNPVNVIKRVNEAKSLNKKTKVNLKKETNDLINATSPKKENWASFIESIKC